MAGISHTPAIGATRAGGLHAPISTIGFERRRNRALQFDSEDAFVEALLRDIPPAPEQQAAIVAANRSGRALVGAAEPQAMDEVHSTLRARRARRAASGLSAAGRAGSAAHGLSRGRCDESRARSPAANAAAHGERGRAREGPHAADNAHQRRSTAPPS